MFRFGHTDGRLAATTAWSRDPRVKEVAHALEILYPASMKPYIGTTGEIPPPKYELVIPVHRRILNDNRFVELTLQATPEGFVLITPLDTCQVSHVAGPEQWRDVLVPIVTNTFAWPGGGNNNKLDTVVITEDQRRCFAVTYESLGVAPDQKRMRYTCLTIAGLVHMLDFLLDIHLGRVIGEIQDRDEAHIAEIMND